MTSLLPMPEKRIFSGIQPTGNLHLGNYLGAIRNWVTLQDDFESIYCVVDLHAITVAQDPQQLRQSTREVAASLIAAGISPKRSVLFNQSSVPQHSQLAWVFNCTARLGWLNRMTQFKEKAGKNRENATVGLLTHDGTFDSTNTGSPAGFLTLNGTLNVGGTYSTHPATNFTHGIHNITAADTSAAGAAAAAPLGFVSSIFNAGVRGPSIPLFPLTAT